MTDYRVVFTAREKAELVPVERDSKPLGAKEIAGPTIATLISAGTELAGQYTGEKFPAIPGYTAIFKVEQIGSDVTGVNAGDLMLSMGAHQSWQRTSIDDALSVPKGLAPNQAVFARLMGVSMSTLSTTTARPPAKVIVTGLGPVGHLASKIFASCGYDVTAIDVDARRRQLAQEMGISNVHPSIPQELVRKIDLVLECSGHEQAVFDGCSAVRPRGEVVLIGSPWKRRTEIYAHSILYLIFRKFVVLRSGWEWELPMQAADFRTNSIWGNIAGALKWIAEGRVKVDAMATTVSPRDAQSAYQNLMQNRIERLSLIYDWTQL